MMIYSYIQTKYFTNLVKYNRIFEGASLFHNLDLLQIIFEVQHLSRLP